MIASIETKYTGDITREEVLDTMRYLNSGHYALPQMQGATQGAEWLKTATSAQIQEVLDWYAPILARELKALDDANRFRPSYAPKGQLTRSQGDTQLAAQQTTRMVRMLTYKRNARAAVV